MHPLSSMLNRNLRVFETIRNATNKEITRQIANLEKPGEAPGQFTVRDFKIHHVTSRLLVMGLRDPQRFFKTLSNGLERVGYETKRVDFDPKWTAEHKRRPSSVSSSGLRVSLSIFNKEF